MAITEAQRRAADKYKRTHIKAVTIQFQANDYDKMKAAAGAAGESMALYARKAIAARIAAESSAAGGNGEREESQGATAGGESD